MKRTEISKNNRHDTVNDVRVFLEREAPNRAKTIEVVCSSARRDMDRRATHVPYRLFCETVSLFPEQQRVGGEEPVQWPSSTDICCWHDCHPFTGTPIPIPKNRGKRGDSNVLVVYGVVCSANCGVAHILERNTYDQQLQLLLFKSMMTDVFGMDATSVFALEPAPPRIFLRMFGGHLSIDEFRQRSLTVRSTMLTPPFISYSMVLEENARVRELPEARVDGAIPPITSHAIRGLRRPTTRFVEDDPHPHMAEMAAESSVGADKPSLFDQFLHERAQGVEEEKNGMEVEPSSSSSQTGSTAPKKRGTSQRKRASASVGGVSGAALAAAGVTPTGTLAAYLTPQ